MRSEVLRICGRIPGCFLQAGSRTGIYGDEYEKSEQIHGIRG